MIAATVRVRSLLTEAATPLCFAGLYLGEQHVTGGVRAAPPARGVDGDRRGARRARSRPPTCSPRSA